MRTIQDLEFSRGAIGTLGHPEVKILVLSRLKEEHIIATLRQMVNLNRTYAALLAVLEAVNLQSAKALAKMW